MRALIVEDEPYLADAVRDGLRLEAIAADIAGDGNTALELLSINSYDLAVLDRDIPGPSGDEIARRIVASGSGTPILMLTAADRIDDKASGFELGADDYLTKPFELRELVMRLRALDRRRAHAPAPVSEIAGLRLDPFRREVFRDGRYVALTRKQFAVLEVLVARPTSFRTAHTSPVSSLAGSGWPTTRSSGRRATREPSRADQAQTAAGWPVGQAEPAKSAEGHLRRAVPHGRARARAPSLRV
jgi:two-component system, OmpR family, response regulator VanR